MASPKAHSPYQPGLGERIRRLRTLKGLRIVDVAIQSGLTPSAISQIERSLITPTIGTLTKIAAVFQCPLVDIIASGENASSEIAREDPVSPTLPTTAGNEPRIVAKDRRKVISPYQGVVYELLTPDFSGPFEFSRNIYQPGAGKGSEMCGHPGVECTVIIEGELLIRYGEAGREYRVKAGESITFDSTVPHSVENPGAVPCVCLWVNNPPWF